MCQEDINQTLSGFILANGVIAAVTLQTSLLKSVFTSVAGLWYQNKYYVLISNISHFILAIFLEKAVFFSKDDFKNKEETLKKFSRFGILNGWAFFVTGR